MLAQGGTGSIHDGGGVGGGGGVLTELHIATPNLFHSFLICEAKTGPSPKLVQIENCFGPGTVCMC